ncbi:hypothetical protein HFV04_026900 [Pseudomonas sp. BIGb0427]|uniref:DUF6630 family protein n=1 Tax=unclassified Pseudomonas TaxID=196821 RepID=UPI0018A73B0C|nr:MULTISPECIES: hypothetical protein [unclassified Pseudomonas]QPG63079.1 hypothetical protein HFV04_026900 [Pseudomonas sp. BIGb0427]QVM98149.1 hypothetical protein JYG36_08195 [Pseudomonas sp. SORT22]UVM54532.1 hypothetical protein LOY37_19580 [Pseudomonas sp. B21-012]UVM65524.1 hypothetical protein LOY34_19695 [Pseudomonas sp. B21-009]
MLKECFTKAQILAAEQLLTLVSPSAAMASQHVQALREVELDEDDIEEFEDDPQQLMYIVKDVADWESVFFVDWKDTESFVQSVQQLAEARDADVTFGVEDAEDEDFLEGTTVPELMVTAHDELHKQGLVLWNWSTDGDCYSGFITTRDVATQLVALGEVLEVEIREGSEPF